MAEGDWNIRMTLAALDSMMEAVKAATIVASRKGAAAFVAQAQQNVTDTFGGRGNVSTGALRASIFADPPEQTGPAEWVTQFAPHTVYGRIQELGGVIVPVRAKSLHFFWQGLEWFRSMVTLPPRPYLQPALTQARPRVEQIVYEEWGNAMSGG